MNKFIPFALCGLLISATSLMAQEPTPPQPPTTTTTPASTASPPATTPAVEPTPGSNLIPAKPAFLMNVAVNRKDATYSQGERLTVRFKAEVDCHVYLLYHQADGSTVLIFPNKAQPDNSVKANTEVSLPKAGDEFRFRVSAPFGKEALQVVAGKQPIAVLDKLDASAGRAVPVTKETQDELAKQIKASADEFAEHRVVIKTHEGGGKLPEPREAKRAGLFVGVNKLKATKHGNEVPQASKSAEIMHEALTTMGGIAPENAKVLTDVNATTAAFEDAMTKWLPSITQPGDTVFLFYCGHGGPEPTKDPSELDGNDEVITTFDSYVVDDQLGRWLQELPGRQIVLMMETCHGGGLVDARAMAGSISEVGRRVHDISDLNTMVICACLPNETSSFSTKREAAYMPEFLIKAMRTEMAPLTMTTAFQKYRERLFERVGTDQEPVFQDNIGLPVYLVPPPAKKP
ncbi:DUF4384 domain-containing protein [Anatilimnocola floriformis]|uniref:DUF4384 domain-containing protein n=1 Tax=Anatilimnocola floriformis TaxID=2948575 RepID=UPI0020C26254|nr:DUF4384 domain-containing protein [Anatilimnocola floriformis]